MPNDLPTNTYARSSGACGARHCIGASELSNQGGTLLGVNWRVADPAATDGNAAMTTANERLFTTWITSFSRVDHAVTDEECAARASANRGAFLAVCGVAFLPAPMEQAPGLPCHRCVAYLRARMELRDTAQRFAPCRTGWIGRMLRRRLKPPADAGCAAPLLDAPAPAGTHASHALTS